MPRKFVYSTLAVLLMAMPAAAAERLAVIIANEDYEDLRDVGASAGLARLDGLFEAQDFKVMTYRDLDGAGIARASRDIVAEMARADMAVVIVGGHVISDDGDAYLLATDATEPSALAPGNGALSIDAIMAHLGRLPGQAVLMVGEARSGTPAAGQIAAGMRLAQVPQGVTVYSGPAADLADVARDLLEPGQSFASVAAAAGRNVASRGFLGAGTGLVPAVAQGPDDPELVETALDFYLFSEAKRLGTAEAYQTYLDRFPNGTYARGIRNLLNALDQSPQEQAQRAEADLRLTLSQRRQIQRDLTLLGYDTRGVDGIFGAGTRRALTNWQSASGLDATGYLTAGGLRLLGEQARDRQAEIDQQDAAFWAETGKIGTEEGYQAYLARYPNGLFADLARSSLDRLADERRAADKDAEDAAWRAADAANTISAYEGFLEDYPDGVHADAAQARLKALRAQQSQEDRDAEIAAAKQAEAGLMANPVLRLLTERRLAQLGYDPGLLDGNFDSNTRTAIRRFQRDQGLAVTGYIDGSTASRLVAKTK